MESLRHAPLVPLTLPDVSALEESTQRIIWPFDVRRFTLLSCTHDRSFKVSPVAALVLPHRSAGSRRFALSSALYGMERRQTVPETQLSRTVSCEEVVRIRAGRILRVRYTVENVRPALLFFFFSPSSGTTAALRCSDNL